MSDNDLIKRGEVQKMHFSCYVETEAGAFVPVLELIQNISNIQAVELPMNAVEYLQTMRLICEDGRNCGKCPLSYNNNGAGINCQDYAAHYPEKAVTAVQKWAAIKACTATLTVTQNTRNSILKRSNG